VVVAPPPPARAQEVAPAPAPRTPLPTPQSAADSWSSGNPLESTGDHDRRLSAAFEAVQDLYFLASSAEGLVFAVKLLQDLVPCEAATGGIYDINTDELRLVALTGTGSEERRAEAIPSSQGLLGAAALTTAEFLVINDVLSDPRFDPAIDGRVGMQTASMLLLPLRRDDNLLGLLQLINRRGGKPFSDADVAVCTYVARQVAEFMQSKRGQIPKRRR
jgi:GAF domain-containing protein